MAALHLTATASGKFAFSTLDAETQAIFDRKNIDFAKTSWPEINPIDLTQPAYNGKKQIPSEKSVRLQNYRYPCVDPANRKGIVQFVHGHGDYAGRYAWLGKELAERGYDFVGLDRRGFGYSEGRRGVIEYQQI